MIPYGKQHIDEDDIRAVVETLRSDYVTTGPKVAEFEKAVADYCGTDLAVAVSNGTTALHTAMAAIGIGPGDEVIVPPITFAASANCVVYCGGKPIFADVRPDSLLLDPREVEAKITDRTKAVIAVDYAGQPCDYDSLRMICDRYNLVLVADAAHSLGASYKGRKTGSLADLTTFSFHPVKHITTGEGGMVLTGSEEFATKMRIFRNHGICTDYRQREKSGAWFYEMTSLGYNYRISDIQCALGISQLKKLDDWVKKRRQIADFYDQEFSDMENIKPLKDGEDVVNSHHLYVVQIGGMARNRVFSQLREEGIGVNVHYVPVHLHPFYRETFGTGEGLCPVAEEAYQQILSLPIYPGLNSQELTYIVKCIEATHKLNFI